MKIVQNIGERKILVSEGSILPRRSLEVSDKTAAILVASMPYEVVVTEVDRQEMTEEKKKKK